MTTESPNLITAKQLSDILGVSTETLAQNRYLNQGVPYIKIGKSVRYSMDDVIAYLENQRVQTNIA